MNKHQQTCFPVFYLFIITPYSVFFVAHHGCRIVFQSRLSPNRKSASIYYIWWLFTHTRAEEWLTFCVSEREERAKTVKGREKWVTDRERKECVTWELLAALVSLALSLNGCDMSLLIWHSNLRAGLKMVGIYLVCALEWMQTVGIAGPTAALHLVSITLVKMTCVIRLASRPRLILVLSLSFCSLSLPGLLFLYCHLQCLCIYLSAPSLLCDIKPTE